MTAKLYAMTCGRLVGRLKDMIEGEDGPVALPIPSYLIEHPKGRALFDTGMHPQCRTDAAGRLGERVARIFGFEQYGAAGRREVAAGIDRPRSRQGRLHRQFASAFRPRRRQRAGSQRHHGRADGANGRPPRIPRRRPRSASSRPTSTTDITVKQVEGEHDLFGDGSVVCIPTYGHTPGHQSLKVRTETGEVVLTGDACYFCRTLRERRLPRFVYDREQMLASLDRLEALERGGAKLFFGHDPDFWKDVPQAPVPAF